jgi:peptide deformylase
MTEYPPENDQRVTHIAQAMLDMMDNVGGVGLAAPQVGIKWRMFVSTFGVFISPQIFAGPDPTLVEMEEGCLSIPGRLEKITRPQTITLSAYDLNGRRYSQMLTGLEARVAQHEVDHLNGILFIDHLEKPDDPT